MLLITLVTEECVLGEPSPQKNDGAVFYVPPAAIDPIRAAIQKIKNHSGSALVVNAQTKRMDTARELLLNSDIEATDYRIIKDQCMRK